MYSGNRSGYSYHMTKLLHNYGNSISFIQRIF